MDDALDMTMNVTPGRARSVHGASFFHAQKFVWNLFWAIHSVEYIRPRSMHGRPRDGAGQGNGREA